jgi:hypothetical protein
VIDTFYVTDLTGQKIDVLSGGTKPAAAAE